MKLNEIALANAAAALTVAVFLFCYFSALFFPGIFGAVSQSWFHSLDLSLIRTTAVKGNVLLGLLSAAALSWISGWLFAWVYNKFTK